MDSSLTFPNRQDEDDGGCYEEKLPAKPKALLEVRGATPDVQNRGGSYDTPWVLWCRTGETQDSE